MLVIMEAHLFSPFREVNVFWVYLPILYIFIYMLPSVRCFGLAEMNLCNYLLNYMFSVSLDGFLFTDLRQICGINPPGQQRFSVPGGQEPEEHLFTTRLA